ncbi:dihydroorotase-like protein [Nitratireductor aestuarii]|uniref:Dihydroorotase-like protein n=1 Tax=Nitratireductor aestuarii TaxID=1735103 RepID=A0A916RZU1_9HYPH|nr:dihydroorotase family protein [Nitratireductor aestuarii]GGA78460.1 dihydroorotase-like protein [Nitratireductor aestuarii]
MASKKLIISGGQVVRPTGVEVLDIVIEDGSIADLVPPNSVTADIERFDASGLTILPGAIDAHIHLGHAKDIARPREPSDAETETAAAARGGVTTVISYVMSSKPHEDDFKDILSVTKAGARTDFGFHFVIATKAQLQAVPRYINEFGVPTAKLFMNIRGSEGDRLGLPPIDDGFTFALLEQLAAHGGMLCPHPENMEIAWLLADRIKSSGRADLSAWNDARPGFIEAEAIRRIAYLAQVAGAPVYCVHTSSQPALEQALKARDEGINIHIETCNHYLTHDVEAPIGVVGKINPPLRKAADREALWAALANGEIDTLASDHIHRSIESKAGDIWTASPGCPGLDTFLQVPLSEGHHKRGIPLQRIAELTAEKPAKLMGLARKGRIAKGMDADLAFVNLQATETIGKESIQSDCGYSIYEGYDLKGTIDHTMVRGRFVWKDRAIVSDSAGHGEYQFRKL